MTKELTTNTGARTGIGQSTHARFALLALLFGAVVIGISGILVKLSETGPPATAFYRVALSLPIFFLMMSATHPRPRCK